MWFRSYSIRFSASGVYAARNSAWCNEARYSTVSHCTLKRTNHSDIVVGQIVVGQTHCACMFSCRGIPKQVKLLTFLHVLFSVPKVREIDCPARHMLMCSYANKLPSYLVLNFLYYYLCLMLHTRTIWVAHRSLLRGISLYFSLGNQLKLSSFSDASCFYTMQLNIPWACKMDEHHASATMCVIVRKTFN